MWTTARIRVHAKFGISTRPCCDPGWSQRPCWLPCRSPPRQGRSPIRRTSGCRCLMAPSGSAPTPMAATWLKSSVRNTLTWFSPPTVTWANCPAAMRAKSMWLAIGPGVERAQRLERRGGAEHHRAAHILQGQPDLPAVRRRGDVRGERLVAAVAAVPGSRFSTRSAYAAATSGPKHKRCNVHNGLMWKSCRDYPMSIYTTRSCTALYS